MTIALVLSLTANICLVALLWADSVAFARQTAVLAALERQLTAIMAEQAAEDADRRYERMMADILPSHTAADWGE